jgi:hypothetical protein
MATVGGFAQADHEGGSCSMTFDVDACTVGPAPRIIVARA